MDATAASDSDARTALLTRGLARGDENAFREFHRLYFDRLYQFLLVVARGNELEAREALQETMLRVLRHARAFADEEIFWSWLKAVARSAARDGGRKQSRYLRLLQNFALRRPDPVVHSAGDDGQLATALDESLDQIEAADRRLLEGKYLEGATVRELSVQTGLTEKAVESRLGRLRAQVRDLMLKKLRTP